MRLLQRTGIYFLIFSSLAFLLAGVVLYLALDSMMDHEMDENLKRTREVLRNELIKRPQLPSSLKIMDEVIDLHEVAKLTNIEIFKDTTRLVEEENEKDLEVFRQYIYTERINGKIYRIALVHSKFDKENLQTAIIGLIVGLLFLFLVMINLFNRYISVQIWKPFYQIIKQVEQFNFSVDPIHQSVATNIEEFKTLDHALQQMTRKITQDYASLKQFTENASHEIQTPLAIIQSQIDLLLQKEMSPDSWKHVNQIQQSTAKLSKLSQSLLLLTRIENRQFRPLEGVDLREIIQRKLDALKIMIEAKSLEVKTDLAAVSVQTNPTLTDVLINNLLSNAIKHNVQNGQITVLLTTKALSIKNTGLPIKVSPIELFERFRKGDDASQSVGLGLAIVKQICNVYDWGIDYTNVNAWHEITIRFK